MTTWSEHVTDKCWEEVKSILTGELDIDIPMTYVSEKRMRSGDTFRHGDHATNQTNVV